MEKLQIMEILEDWNFWSKDHDVGLIRERYIQELKKLAETEQIVVVTGVRRSGKSTIMLQYIKKVLTKHSKNVLYVNFEDARFKELNLDLLNKIYETYLEYIQPEGKQYIFLDEIQNIEKWEKFVRTLHELKKAQIFISGSNSRLLKGKLASALTGRHLDLKVFPLNFREFLQFKEVEIKNKLDLISKRYKIKSTLNEYLLNGGFPLVCLKKNKKELLQTYFEDIIYKDIIEHKTITNVSKMKLLAKFYLSNAGRRVSFRNLARIHELSLDTIERYSAYLEESYLINFIKKFSYSLKEQEKTMAVVYTIDNGLMNLVGFKFSNDTGWLYQNIVANYLFKKFEKESIFYWTCQTKEEVDFVVKQNLKVKKLIQVCYKISDSSTKKREITALIKASKELRCNNLIIITDEYEAEEKIKNKKIKYIPLWKWLLEEKE